MKNKTNLDEMQEQKLLKIEHNACWLAFWGLLISMLVQMFIENGSFRTIAGEWIVFMILAIYLFLSCMKNGIWDRKLKPNFKTNIIFSFVASLIYGVIQIFISYNNYNKLGGAIATGVFMFVQLFILVFIGLSICSAIFKNKKNKIENEPDGE